MKSESGFTLLTTHYLLFVKFFFSLAIVLSHLCKRPCWKRRDAFLLPPLCLLSFWDWQKHRRNIVVDLRTLSPTLLLRYSNSVRI